MGREREKKALARSPGWAEREAARWAGFGLGARVGFSFLVFSIFFSKAFFK